MTVGLVVGKGDKSSDFSVQRSQKLRNIQRILNIHKLSAYLIRNSCFPCLVCRLKSQYFALVWGKLSDQIRIHYWYYILGLQNRIFTHIYFDVIPINTLYVPIVPVFLILKGWGCILAELLLLFTFGSDNCKVGRSEVIFFNILTRRAWTRFQNCPLYSSFSW